MLKFGHGRLVHPHHLVRALRSALIALADLLEAAASASDDPRLAVSDAVARIRRASEELAENPRR